MQARVISILFDKDVEEIPHDRGANCGERFAGNGDDRARVMAALAQLDNCRQDAVCLARSRAALVNLDLARASLDVVVCCWLLQWPWS